MSIEKDIERIAVALEKQVEISSALLAQRQIGAASSAAPVVEDQIPGLEDEKPQAPTVMAAVGIKTLEDLRTFVQKYLTAAEKAVPSKTEAVVTFVKNELCPKFAPKEPKLMKIPVGKVSEAAQMMYNWGLKNDLIVE